MFKIKTNAVSDAKLRNLMEKAKARYDAMTPEQRAVMDRDQKRSWVRGELMLGMEWDGDTSFAEATKRVEARMGKFGT